MWRCAPFARWPHPNPNPNPNPNANPNPNPNPNLNPNPNPNQVKKMAGILEAEGVALDIGAYRSAPPGFRVWCATLTLIRTRTLT